MLKNLIKFSTWSCAIACMSLLSAQADFSNYSGGVTPSGLKITVKSASLISADGNTQKEIFSGSYEAEFTRSGKSLAKIPLTQFSAPAGRYIGISLSFAEAYSVKLNGDTFVGTGGSLAAGDALYTTTAGDGRANNAVTKTAGTAVYVTNIKTGGSSGCTGTCSSQTYFTQVACIASSASQCQTGDLWIGGDGKTNPDLNILLDIYQSIIVDATNLSLAKGPTYPVPVFGTPGASIHLTAVHTTSGKADGSSNISMLFSSDKKLQYVSSYYYGASGANGPTGGRTPGVTATAGPNLSSYGATMVQKFDSTTGKLQFALGGSDNGTYTSKGLAVFDNILQAVGSTVNFTCTADTTGALDYTYTGGSCSTNDVKEGAMVVTQIRDENNIFGICASGSCNATSTQLTGTAADGYL